MVIGGVIGGHNPIACNRYCVPLLPLPLLAIGIVSPYLKKSALRYATSSNQSLSLLVRFEDKKKKREKE